MWLRRNRILVALSALAMVVWLAQMNAAPDKPASAEAHVGKGYQYLQNRRYSEAAQEFEAALSLNPHLVQARYEMAICEFALARLDAARAQFLQVERETSASPEVSYYLGRIDLREGNYERAIRKLLKISSSPPFPDTPYYLGSAYLGEGNLVQAEKWLREAATANPRDFRVADHLARVYQKEKRSAKAEREYTLSSRLRQYYDRAASRSIDCERALDTERRDQAHAICERLFDPHDQDKLILLGIIYGRHRDYEAALKPLETAVRMDPDSWAAEHNLGLTYFRLRRYSEALPALHRAVELRPEYFGSCALLGATLYTLRHDNEAFRILEEAHQLNPQDSDTSELLFNESLILARQRYMSKRFSDSLKFLLIASQLRPGDTEVQKRITEVQALAKAAQ